MYTARIRALLKETYAGDVWRKFQRLRKAYRGYRKERRKYVILLAYTEKYKPRVFVETGTYLGNMVARLRNKFEKMYTIELSRELYIKARNRFSSYRNIHVIYGDSELELPKVLKELEEPALFWLDAHYSRGFTARGNEDTPIQSELRAIKDHHVKSHVIIVDDAKDFTGDNGYPTLEWVKDFFSKSAYETDVKDGVIRVVPRRPSI